MDDLIQREATMDTSVNANTVYSDCYWTDDSINAFREAVRAEGYRQVMASDESQAELLAEKIFAQHVKLLRTNPAEFAKQCAEMIVEAAEDFAETTIVARVMDFCDTPKAEGMSVREMVEHVLSDQFSPWAPGKGP